MLFLEGNVNTVLGGNTDTSTTTGSVVSDNLGLFLHGDWDDLGGEVEVLAQVLDALVGQHPVEVAPRKLLLQVTAGSQRLAS